MKDKFKYLFKNTGLLFISNFSSKFLVFLLVPLYTNVLTTEEYGSYDLIYTAVQFIVPFLCLNMIDAIMRFSIGTDKKHQKITFTIGIKYIFIAIIASLIITNFATKLFNIYTLEKYKTEFLLLFAAYIIHAFIVQFARGIDDVLGMSIAGIISTFVMLVLNIVFLLYFKFGIYGYFYAMIISSFVSSIFLFVRNRMYQYLKRGYNFFKIYAEEKEMLRFCLPLIFITLSWNINNFADRYTVTFFNGVAANGVFSVAYKIPAILNTFQAIFIQAWQLSAIREYNATDGEIFYRKTYQCCYVGMVMLCSTVIIFTRILAKILFAKEFYKAWVYVPVLLIYIVFNTLSGTIGAVFTAVKDSKTLAITGILGAFINIILNVLLVYLYGPMGAAVATLISSIVIWVMRMVASRKYIVLKLRYIRHMSGFIILLSQAILMTLSTDIRIYILQILLWILLFLLCLFETRSVMK